MGIKETKKGIALLMLTTLLMITGGGRVRAGIYEWTYDKKKTTLSPAFEYKSGSSYETKITCTIVHDKITYTNALKMEGATRIYFPTSAKTSEITVAYVLRTDETESAYQTPAILLCTKTDEANEHKSKSCQKYTYKIDEKTTYIYYFVTYTDVPSGDWAIKNAGAQIGIFYIKIENYSNSSTLSDNGHSSNDTKNYPIWESYKTDGATLYLGGWKYQSNNSVSSENKIYSKYTKGDGYVNKDDDKGYTDRWDAALSKYSVGDEDPYKRKNLTTDPTPGYEIYSYGRGNARNEFTEGKYWGRYEFADEIENEYSYPSGEGDGTYTIYKGGRVKGNPFTVPCMGCFAKIEPDKNGIITLHVLQNSTVDFEASAERGDGKDGNYDEQNSGTLLSGASWRPIFIVDEMGTRFGETDVKATTTTEHTIGRHEENALLYNYNKKMIIYCVEQIYDEETKEWIDGEVLTDFYSETKTKRDGYYEISDSGNGLQTAESGAERDYVYLTADDKTNNKKTFVRRITFRESVEEEKDFIDGLKKKLNKDMYNDFFTKKLPVYYDDEGNEAPYGTTDNIKYVEVWPEHVRGDKSDDAPTEAQPLRVWGPKYTGDGWVVISKGYIDYEFPVKAGKSYYFFSNDTKFGFCGYEFTPDDEEETQTLTLDENGTYKIGENGTAQPITNNGTINSTLAGTYASVTLKHSFHEGWNAICLPFSVTESKMREWFGTNGQETYELVTYNGAEQITGDKQNDKSEDIGKLRAHFFRHVYQDIVAGIPYMLYIPAEARAIEEDVVFENITIDKNVEMRTFKSSYDNMPTIDKTKESPNGTDGDKYLQAYGYESLDYLYKKATETDYISVGNYMQVNIEKGAYVVAKPGIQLYDNTTYNGELTLAGFRSYLKPNYPTALFSSLARIASTNFTLMIDEQEDNMNATVINDLLAEELGFFNHPSNVYSISGQMVRANSTSLVGLPKGIYIVNGKKFFVK